MAKIYTLKVIEIPLMFSLFGQTATPQRSRLFSFSGKVFVKENRTPLSDLVVSLFDLDPRGAQQVNSTATVRFDDFPSEYLERLGSTLTDRAGGFQLTFDNFEFAQQNLEQKPDLLLVIQAPAEPNASRGNMGTVLYWGMLLQPDSFYGLNAARNEALAIALPRRLLKQNAIPVPGETAFESTDVVRRSADTAQIYIDRGFSGYSADERAGANYWLPGSGGLLEKLLNRDRESLLQIPTTASVGGMRISANGLNQLGFTEDTAQVDSNALIRNLQRRIGDGVLRRPPNAEQNCRLSTDIEQALRELNASSPGDSDTAGGSEEPVSNDDADAADIGMSAVLEDIQGDLRDWVRAQLGTAVTPEMSLNYGGYQKPGDPSSVLNVRVNGGPADATAIFDYKQLVFAYKHIWTEAFDESYADALADAIADTFTPEVGAAGLVGPYKFDLYAPNTVNYGLQLTYQQIWDVQGDQAGKLRKTLPLTPGESREYAVTRSRKITSLEKRIEEDKQRTEKSNNSAQSTVREAAQSAQQQNSFQMNASGNVSVGVFSGGASTSVGVQAAKNSEQTKKANAERTRKKLQEIISQQQTEFTTSTETNEQISEKGIVKNENEEITVTYLFYELQRRYKVREALHEVRPVIFVANDVPHPHELTEAWLRDHAWILKRVLLDTSLNEALEYSMQGLAADESALQALEEVMTRRRIELDNLEAELEGAKKMAEETFSALGELARGANSIGNDRTADVAKDAARALAFGPFGGFGRRRRRRNRSKQLKKYQESLELQLEREDESVDELEDEVSEADDALENATQAYNAAKQMLTLKNGQIRRLTAHVRDNILYYMHAIWDHEPPDQRLFRLHNVKVNWFREPPPDSSGELVDIIHTDLGFDIFQRNLRIPLPVPNADLLVERSLIEVAHCDQVLGYFGNYTVLPAKSPNLLHLYMLQDYIDAEHGGLRDPDAFADAGVRDILSYLACLRASGRSDYGSELARLTPLLEARRAANRAEAEDVVVPTDSLFIQAMPDASNPVLEDFKLAHRALDVKKVQAEVRRMEIENQRRGGRLLNDDFTDPAGTDRIEQNWYLDDDDDDAS